MSANFDKRGGYIKVKTVIITGLSGAGKSIAADALEDLGYFCVDNLPAELIMKFADLLIKTRGGLEKVAVVCDIRSGDIGNLEKCLFELKESDMEYEILYLEASDDVLVKRYKESRRQHPLSGGGPLIDSIQKERECFKKIKEIASYDLDTSFFTAAKLKEYVTKLFADDSDGEKLIINVVSFGFKNGIPLDSDLVFDVRFLPNPFYIHDLKFHTGLEKNVYDYVMGFEETKIFIDKLIGLLEYLIPLYAEEGKSQLVISIGCTGGHHRSVTVAENLSKTLKADGHKVIITHRDIQKNV